MRRALTGGIVGAMLLTGCAAPSGPPAQDAAERPTRIALPAGWQPEGIAVDGDTAFLGSRADGAIYRADLATGEGAVLAAGPGTPSLGLEVLPGGRLLVAGGTGGDARLLDTATGETLASYPLATGESFVNDVVVAGGAAWFTDSTNPVLYRVPVGDVPAPPGEVTRVPLTGALVYGEGINANGIEATPDGSGLVVVQSGTGLLFHVDPATGVTAPVDLGGELLTGGDGLTLDGSTLYAVQNRDNTVAVVDLAADGRSGRVTQRISDPAFDVPTTVARAGDRLYLPNARFSTESTPETSYDVVSVPVP